VLAAPEVEDGAGVVVDCAGAAVVVTVVVGGDGAAVERVLVDDAADVLVDDVLSS
jgi:hypothetical protein